MNLTFKFLTICLRLLAPGGHKKLIAENLALRQQLICYSRQTSKSPALKPTDRIIFSILAFFIPKSRLHKVVVLISPSTIIKFHRALVKKKYQILFGTKSKGKKGRKEFGKKIIDLILEIKTKNPSFGCPRIAMVVTNATGEPISEHTVRRVLKRHFRPRGDGPSWLSFIGSLDFFRCESITLKNYFNEARPHYSLRGKPPNKYPELKEGSAFRKGRYQFARYCNGMFSIPLAA